MATSSMIPYSNPAGKNQTSGPAVPTSRVGAHSTGGPAPIVAPVPSTLQPTAVAAANPLVPASATVPNVGAPIPSTTNVSGTTGALQKQETDIFGKGIGGSITDLLEGIGGVDSATLQEYIQSLAPQEATAKANLDASLGAAGVSGNSSVAALGEANLEAQETGAIAGEEAQLTQSGQNLEASILTGQQQDAEKEVATSGLDVFGSVLSDVGKLAGATIGAAGAAGGFSNLF